MRARVPGARRTASAERMSASISSCAGSPISIRSSPAAMGVRLWCWRLVMTPAMGAVTATAAAPASLWLASRARADWTRAAAIFSSAWAAARLALVLSRWARAWSSCSRLAAWALTSGTRRWCSFWARVCALLAAAMCWRAASSAASAPRRSASACSRLRASSGLALAGSISASVCPARTLSPACRVMRRRVPETGAWMW